MKIFLPIYYTCYSRLRSNFSRLAWLFTYLFPLLIIGYLTDISILQVFLLVLSIYLAYEIGYIYNDCEVVKKEKKPTLRLLEQDLVFYELNKKKIYILRILFLCLSLIINYFVYIQYFFFVICTVLGILFSYFLYNSIRNNLNLPIYFLLVWLRYFSFFVFVVNSFELFIFTLLVYPFCVSIEFSAKDRFFTSRFVKIKDIDKFRVLYYILLFFLSLTVYFVNPSQNSLIFLCLSVYFFIYRFLSFLFLSKLYRK